jgi:hypothetical protein
MSKEKKVIKVGYLPDNPDIATFILDQMKNLSEIEAKCQRQEIDPYTREILFNIIWGLTQPKLIELFEHELRIKRCCNRAFPQGDNGVLVRISLISREQLDELQKEATTTIVRNT